MHYVKVISSKEFKIIPWKNGVFHMTKNTTILFAFLASMFVLSTLVKPYPLSWAVKLLPMLLLIGVAIGQLGFVKENKYFILGLIFSACGDFILDVDRQNWFIFGLGAFFIAHLFYLTSLKPYHNKLVQVKYLIPLLAYIAYGAVMLMLLADGLGQIFMPVVGYMSILLLMALATILSKKSNVWLVIGGLSFVLSDSLIGFDKFYMAIDNSHFVVMTSYYFAQFSLLKGFINSTIKRH